MAFLQLTAQGEGGGFSMPVLLLPPLVAEGDESENTLCPITHEPIGSKTYCPPHCSIEGTPLLTNPKYASLLCVELTPCKHRFDARALVAHFLHNGMSCPLCRQGDSSAVFDPIATFKNFEVSNWVLAHPRRPAKRRRIMVNSLMAAILLFDSLEADDSLLPLPLHVEVTFALLPV